MAIPSQYNSSNDNSLLGKRDLPRTDFESEPKRKRPRRNSRAPITQQSANSSIPPLFSVPNDTVSASGLKLSGGDTTLEDIVANWSITYNNEVERAFDVRLVRSVDLGVRVSFLKFSKDGKYVAVGFHRNGSTDIYDVRTGKKTWLVDNFFSSLR